MAYPYGCVFLARKILNSNIWLDKPSWWLKVWIYLLLKVHHNNSASFKRGQNFFTRDQIHHDCKLQLDGIKVVTVDNVLRWLKCTQQITTQKTTRGMIITVCNYESYQSLVSYKNDTENDTINALKTQQKRNRNAMLYKKNERIKEDIYQGFELLWGKYPIKEGKKQALIHYKYALSAGYAHEDIVKALANYLKKIEIEKIEAKYIKHASTFFNDWEDYLDYEPPKPKILSRTQIAH
jgi:hypothetical protein